VIPAFKSWNKEEEMDMTTYPRKVRSTFLALASTCSLLNNACSQLILPTITWNSSASACRQTMAHKERRD